MLDRTLGVLEAQQFGHVVAKTRLSQAPENILETSKYFRKYENIRTFADSVLPGVFAGDCGEHHQAGRDQTGLKYFI